jgi:hypothetical protein
MSHLMVGFSSEMGALADGFAEACNATDDGAAIVADPGSSARAWSIGVRPSGLPKAERRQRVESTPS